MKLTNNLIVVFFCVLISIVGNNIVNCTFCKSLPTYMEERLDEYWCEHKDRYDKVYSVCEDIIKKKIWEKNFRLIYNHNSLVDSGLFSFTLQDNQFSDLSSYDFFKKVTTLIPSKHNPVLDKDFVGSIQYNPSEIPPSLDWRERGFITPSEDQLDCNCCYAIAIARSIQGHVFRKYNVLLNLSVQQLLDCSTQTGNLGCTGGSLRNTLTYLEGIKGIMHENNYPFTGRQGECKFQNYLSAINVTSGALLPPNDEKMMEAIVAELGPIAASLNASPKSFRFYSSGVYDDPECTSDIVNHAVLIVGYTPDYWIIKNSWTSEWGEQGYMRIAKMKNMCGISNFVAYVKI